MAWLRLAIAVGCSVGGLSSSARAAEPGAFFRAGFGIVDDAGTLPEEVDSGDAIVWKVPLAKGHSTPIVHGDALYLTTFDGKTLATVCLDRATGATRWSQVAPNDRLE